MVSWPLSASLRDLLEMGINRSTLDLLNQTLWGWGPESGVFTSLSCYHLINGLWTASRSGPYSGGKSGRQRWGDQQRPARRWKVHCKKNNESKDKWVSRSPGRIKNVQLTKMSKEWLVVGIMGRSRVISTLCVDTQFYEYWRVVSEKPAVLL